MRFNRARDEFDHDRYSHEECVVYAKNNRLYIAIRGSLFELAANATIDNYKSDDFDSPVVEGVEFYLKPAGGGADRDLCMN